MLVHLHVKNLALIQEAQADFGPGLNILVYIKIVHKNTPLQYFYNICRGAVSYSFLIRSDMPSSPGHCS